jgi:hypothetical protein
MTRWYKFVLYYLWIAPHVLLVPLSVLFFVRRLYKDFPVFFVYTVYETIGFLIRFATYTYGHSPSLYQNIFIASAAGSTALRFGIIQEIFNNVFRDNPQLERVATVSMRWLTGLLVLAAILAASYSSGTTPANLMVGIRLLERSVTIIQAGLLLFLFLFSRMFGLSWQSYTFGVALGFAVFASTEIAGWTLGLMALSEHSRYLLDLLPTGSYHVAVLVWLGYLLKAEKPVHAAANPVPEIEQWSGELERSR